VSRVHEAHLRESFFGVRTGRCHVSELASAAMVSLRGIVLAGTCLVAGACSFEPPPNVGADAGPDGSTDPTVDAAIDAPLRPAFDVAYPSEWRFSVNGTISGYLLIVNTSLNPLDLSTFEVVSISDDHPMAIVRVTAPTAFSEALGPGFAAGELSGLSQDVLVDSGLVTEPNHLTEADFLRLDIEDAPNDTYDIGAEVTLSIDDIAVELPMTIHRVAGPNPVYADPLVGRRVMAYR